MSILSEPGAKMRQRHNKKKINNTTFCNRYGVLLPKLKKLWRNTVFECRDYVKLKKQTFQSISTAYRCYTTRGHPSTRPINILYRIYRICAGVQNGAQTWTIAGVGLVELPRPQYLVVTGTMRHLIIRKLRGKSDGHQLPHPRIWAESGNISFGFVALSSLLCRHQILDTTNRV